jgi:hypothetical protein
MIKNSGYIIIVAIQLYYDSIKYYSKKYVSSIVATITMEYGVYQEIYKEKLSYDFTIDSKIK